MSQFREKEVLAYGERQVPLISSGIGHFVYEKEVK